MARPDRRFIITTDVARASVEYARQKNISKDEALRIFLGSATYRALSDTETGLCYEMFEAIYELFLEEMGEVCITRRRRTMSKQARTLENLKAELMENAEFQTEYEALEPEFDIVHANIHKQLLTVESDRLRGVSDIPAHEVIAEGRAMSQALSDGVANK